MSYKSLKDTGLKITPTCFGSQRIHHQGVITCTLNEITCRGSQIFIMCMVGVWRRNSEPVVCVCVCVNAHTLKLSLKVLLHVSLLNNHHQGA